MWYFALKISELPAGTGKSLQIEGKRVALFNVDGKYFALSDACLHRGGPLGEGHLEGATVTCPWHAWDFDVTTGKCGTMPGATQPRFKTKVENEGIWVEI